MGLGGGECQLRSGVVLWRLKGGQIGPTLGCGSRFVAGGDEACGAGEGGLAGLV